ncbi:MAG: cytochrome c oxidase accessory protein CcoG, partial [Rhodospirillales bacterium]|nr:cytochrome c oxidase accessory protein CcoG [Rhodospirillales bacterium]
LFLWVEAKVEGDRTARMQLDRAPWSAPKLARKVIKHLAFILISFLTGGAWVMYFNDAPTVIRELATFTAGPWTVTFFFLFTATTYIMAGWAREQACIYMCPYARFQGAMLDEDSLIITYEAWRGEPRAPVGKGRTDFADRGHCVDCRACVQVCPTGIDIRKGSQLECINCGLCVDACNQVMDRFKLPRGLIRYDSITAQAARAARRPGKTRFLRPRTFIYAAVLAAVGGLMILSLATRDRLGLNVIHERSPLFVRLSDGSVRNAYTLKTLNMLRQERRLELAIEGIEPSQVAIVGQEAEGARARLFVGADQVGEFRLFVTLPPDRAPKGSTPMAVRITDSATGETALARDIFAGPER